MQVDGLINFIVARHKAIVALFAIVMVASAACIPFVRVNYDMVDYLPPSAQSTTAVDIMTTEQFDQAVPNAYVMVRDVTPARRRRREAAHSLHGRRRDGSFGSTTWWM